MTESATPVQSWAEMSFLAREFAEFACKGGVRKNNTATKQWRNGSGTNRIWKIENKRDWENEIE